MAETLWYEDANRGLRVMSDTIGQTGMASDGRSDDVISQRVSTDLLPLGPVFWRPAKRGRQ